MIYDERFGWVDRGTPGHRASAQVVDVDAEILALRRIKARPAYDMDGAHERLSWVWLYNESAKDARRERDQYLAGFDVGQGGTTTFTTYAVEGDTLRIVHSVQLPVRAQTINVNVTVGGADEP